MKVAMHKPDDRRGVFAIKRTRLDKKYKNRELSIMLAVDHPAIVQLKYYFYESVIPGRPVLASDSEVQLNLVLEYMPQTIYRNYREYAKRGKNYPELYIKLYSFQILRAIAYLHGILGIMHRDLKPHNVLVDPESGRAVLIDFGSAKVVRKAEANVSYTCSRYYRAPELIFGMSSYDQQIDLWSMGCILGELMKGTVLFPGTSSIDQLVEIIKVLGTPTKEQIKSMSAAFSDHRFPLIKPASWNKVFPRSTNDAIDFTKGFLVYEGSSRVSAIESLTHRFFDELRSPSCRLPSGRPLPPIFDFSVPELSLRPELIRRLVPPHTELELFRRRGVDIANFKPVDVSSYKVNID